MKRALFTGIVLTLAGVGNGWGQVQYSVTGLGSIGGYSFAYGINASGQVVGQAEADYTGAPVLYGGGSIQILAGFGRAYGINASGQVVGYADNNYAQVMPSFTAVARCRTSARFRVNRRSCAYGINDSAQIVGYANNSNGISLYPQYPFLYSGGSMQNLGTVAGSNLSSAFAINDSGQIVGGETAFLYSGGSKQIFGTVPAGLDCGATGINASGQVVGYVDTAAGQHAAFYGGGSSLVLQDIGGEAKTTVGPPASTTVDRSWGILAPLLFLYSNGVMQNLNNLIPPNSGWTLTEATGINDSGQICGYGFYSGNSSGQYEAFLLTPIPEPSTLALLAAGSLGPIGHAWRRRRAA